MINVQNFQLDVSVPAIKRLRLVNGDTANQFVITVTNNKVPVTLDTSLHKVIAVFKRADGQVYTQDADTGVSFTTSGVVTVDVRPASFRTGTNTICLQIYKRENSSATEYPLLLTTQEQQFNARSAAIPEAGAPNSPSQLPMLEQIIHDAGEATTAANNAATAANNAASSATSAASSANTAASNANTAASAANTAAAAANAAAALYPGIYMLPYETSEWIDGTDGAAYDYQTELTITDEEYRALLENKPDVVLGVRVTLPSGKEVTLIEYNRHGAPNTTDMDFKADDVVDGYFVTAMLVENWEVALVIKLWTAEHYVGYNDLIEEMVSASRNLNNLPIGRYKSEQALPEAVVNPTTKNKYVGLTDVLAVQARTKYTVKFYNLSPMTGDITVSFYDSSKQYISHSFSSGVGKTYSFITPVNCAYIHIWKYTSNMWVNIKNTRIMLEYNTGTDYDYGYVGPRTLIDDTARVAAAEAQKKANALGTRVTALEGDGPIVLHVASVTERQGLDGRYFITFEDGEADIIYANAFTRDMEFEMPAQITAQTVTNASIRMRKISAKTDTSDRTLVAFGACSFGYLPNITYAVAGVYFTGDTFYSATYDEGEVTLS